MMKATVDLFVHWNRSTEQELMRSWNEINLVVKPYLNSHFDIDWILLTKSLERNPDHAFKYGKYRSKVSKKTVIKSNGNWDDLNTVWELLVVLSDSNVDRVAVQLFHWQRQRFLSVSQAVIHVTTHNHKHVIIMYVFNAPWGSHTRIHTHTHTHTHIKDTESDADALTPHSPKPAINGK